MNRCGTCRWFNSTGFCMVDPPMPLHWRKTNDAGHLPRVNELMRCARHQPKPGSFDAIHAGVQARKARALAQKGEA